VINRSPLLLKFYKRWAIAHSPAPFDQKVSSVYPYAGASPSGVLATFVLRAVPTPSYCSALFPLRTKRVPTTDDVPTNDRCDLPYRARVPLGRL